jgi:(S)-ureidoglycine aminohydrolase
LPTLTFGQYPKIEYKKYSWVKPKTQSHPGIFSAVIFEGSAYDMEFIQMTANAIVPSTERTTLEVPKSEEHLLLVKDGTLAVGIGDSSWSLGGGSVALLLPGERISLHNSTTDSCNYYLMKYRSKKASNPSVSKAKSFVKDWNKIVFKPHDKGGIRNYFEVTTPMGKRLEMHVTTLKEGLKSHEPHTHRAEEIVLMIDNKTEMQIGDRFFKGGAGDIYYLGSNVPHAIRNDGNGTCTYFAFQFE